MPSSADYFKQRRFSDCDLLIQPQGAEHGVDEREHKRVRTEAHEPHPAAFPAHRMVLCNNAYFKKQVSPSSVRVCSIAPWPSCLGTYACMCYLHALMPFTLIQNQHSLTGQLQADKTYHMVGHGFSAGTALADMQTEGSRQQ